MIIFIFLPPSPPPCQTDSPRYNSPSLLLNKNATIQGSEIKYVFCGLIYCDPEKYWVDMWYKDPYSGNSFYVNGQEGSKCDSLDGRCFECEVNITSIKPITNPITLYVDAMYNSKGSTSNSPDWVDYKFLTLCPSDGRCYNECGAYLECDRKSPGSWREGNIKKICDSNCVYSFVYCSDLNNDGKINMLDIGTVARAFGMVSDNPLWNPNIDLNNDGKINMFDVGTVARNFGANNSTDSPLPWPC